MRKRIFTALLTTGAIAAFTTVMQASQAAEPVKAPDLHEQQKSIVGSWLGTLGNGDRIVVSFTSDGIALGSVQGEVSATFPVLTPTHGAWTHLGGRQFALTGIGILYDLQTGGYQGFIKVRASLTLNRAGDQISGTDRAEVFGPDGKLVDSFSSGEFHYTRIKIELFD